MADATAMTVDFLRARLLSERSVSRAANERADELAKRVEELEEKVRAVTAQRRQAERAAAEVLAILDAQGFGAHLSDDDDDSGSDVGEEGEEQQQQGAKTRGGIAARGGGDGEEEPAAAARGEAEDALSGTAQQPGGLSWKGRSVSPRKARQLKHRHRRSYLHLLSSSADSSSSPKYQMGQSCRKNKRRVELRSAAPDDDGGDAGSQKGRQDGSDFTDDGGHADMDGEVGGDERSSGDGGGGQYVIRYEKDGEMERVLERQAELIGQYEEEEKAQREWEKQYNENRNANKGDVEAKSSEKRTTSTSNPSAECLPNGSLAESPQTASQQNDEPAYVSAQESSVTSIVTRQDQQDQGAEISDGDSGYCSRNAGPLQLPAIKAPSEGSPTSDTLNSKLSDWSSSRFHDHTYSPLETQSYQPASTSIMDIERVLQALQRARISLSAKLSKPVPPSQVTLALPAPGDEYKEHDDPPGNGDGGSSYREEVSSSSPARQEILALPAPEGYREREDSPANDAGISVAGKLSSSSPPREEILALPAPGDDYLKELEDFMKIPVGAPGLFRLPTDSFPADEKMFSGDGRGSEFGLAAAAARRGAGSSSSTAASPHGAAASVPSVPGDCSAGLSAEQCYDDLHGSALLSVPTSGRCNSIPRSGFLSGIPGLEEDLRRGRALGDADLFMQRAIDYTVSNKWML